VNRFTTEELPIEGLMRVNEEAARVQIERLEKLRKERNDGKVKASLDRLEQVAQTEENTVPAILGCVENYCTLGEISQVFRGVFGEQEGTLSF
jgi:methylmalonyl-CoA mutase N-terminal domain/subunit